MNRNDIESNILQSIIEVALCEKGDFDLDTKIVDIDYLDSLDHIEIMMKIEKKCGVLIADDKCEMLTKIPLKDVVDVIYNLGNVNSFK